MAEKTLIATLVTVHCLAHTNYRRAGIAFNHGENTLKPNSVTTSQLAQLKADPRLKVIKTDEEQQASVSEADVSNIDLSQSASGDKSGGESMDDGGSSSGLEGEESPAKPKALGDAIELLDPSNVKHFTTSGKPQVDALGELMGVKVSATERDEAWALVQAEQVTPGEGTSIDTDTEKGE